MMGRLRILLTLTPPIGSAKGAAWCGALVLAVIMAACVPVALPPQVQHTPGPAFTVTDRTFRSSPFALDYPAGWRLITNEAARPLVLILAAPDNAALLVIALGPVSEPPDPPDAQGAIRRELDTMVIDGQTIGTARVAAADSWERYAPVFDAVLATLRPAD